MAGFVKDLNAKVSALTVGPRGGPRPLRAIERTWRTTAVQATVQRDERQHSSHTPRAPQSPSRYTHCQHELRDWESTSLSLGPYSAPPHPISQIYLLERACARKIARVRSEALTRTPQVLLTVLHCRCCCGIAFVRGIFVTVDSHDFVTQSRFSRRKREGQAVRSQDHELGGSLGAWDSGSLEARDETEIGTTVEMSIDVCEGCRRLRKRCDKDDCVLQPCLESLWKHNKLYQGNATVFLAKYFGRKRFFELLQDVTKEERPALFRSLLHEACGRTVNPVSGAIGLKTTSRWHLCEEAVENVLTAGSLNPVTVSPDTSCLSTTSSSCSLWRAKRERDVDESDVSRLPELVPDCRVRRRHPHLNLDLNLSLHPV